MSIALVCDWYAPRRGGIESHLDGLGQRLAGAGHDVHVITSTPGPEGRVGDVTVHRLTAPRLPGAQVVFTPSALREIDDILRKEQIDIVHAHVSIIAPVGIGGAARAQALGFPTVVTFHSIIPATSLWARIIGGVVGASRWTATMTAVSSRVSREVSSFAPNAAFQLLPNAIDTAFWTPGPTTNPDRPVTLVYVGRFHSKKQPMLALDVAREMRRRNHDFKLVCIGSGPMEAAIRRTIERDGLDSQVSILGWSDPTTLRQHLRNADVFLATSRRESFGLAALEARSVGLAVVGMRDSGVADFIEQGVSGVLASSDREFVQEACQLASNSQRFAGIVGFNRSTPTPFSWDDSLQRHLALYEQAIRLRGPASSGTARLGAASPSGHLARTTTRRRQS